MIPEHIKIEGKEIDLRDVVYHFLESENPTPGQVKDALSLATVLENKARDLESEIKYDKDLSRSDACAMMNEAAGLLRAVDEIRSLDREGAALKRLSIMAKVEDSKRWQKFIKEAR